MAERIIRKNPDPVLRQEAKGLTRPGNYLHKLLDDMKETMEAADGVGLAAPQIGISKRIVVIEVGDSYFELINPVIVVAEGEQWGVEGCLSIPELMGRVKRAEHVVVEAKDRDMKEISVDATGLLAVALQHELDHLDGILFIDRATELFNPDDLEDEHIEESELDSE